MHMLTVIKEKRATTENERQNQPEMEAKGNTLLAAPCPAP